MQQTVENILNNTDPSVTDTLAAKLTKDIQDAITKEVSACVDLAFKNFHERLSLLEKFVTTTPSVATDNQDAAAAAA